LDKPSGKADLSTTLEMTKEEGLEDGEDFPDVVVGLENY